MDIRKYEIEKTFIEFKEFIEKDFPNVLEGRDSGSFVIINYKTKNFIQVNINKIPEEKKEKYVFLSKEKAERLLKNLSYISSYESRNIEYLFSTNNQKWGKWGGAIRVSDSYIFSFSGFPELIDEAFVCFIALKYDFLKKDYLEKIIERRSDNPYLKKLKEL